MQVSAQESIEGTWANPLSGETLSFSAEGRFQESTSGDGAYSASADYGSNYKLDFRSGLTCWYHIVTLRSGSALNLNVRRGGDGCPRGSYDKADGDSPPATIESAPSKIASPSSTDTKIVGVQTTLPLSPSGTLSGAVKYEVTANDTVYLLEVPFSGAENTEDAIAQATTRLETMFGLVPRTEK